MVAQITRFGPPTSALTGDAFNIPIQIRNIGVDIFDANIDLYDAETGIRLYHNHKSNFLSGQIIDFEAPIIMPNKNLSLLLELATQPNPVSIFTVVDTRTATITLGDMPPPPTDDLALWIGIASLITASILIGVANHK